MPSAGYIRLKRRRRDDRLLERQPRVPLRDLEVAVRVALVAERARGQPRHATRVPGGERDLEAVGSGIRKPVDAVGPEVVVLPLLAVGDHRRPGRFEALDRVADRVVVERVEARIVAAEPFHGLDERAGTRDGFRWVPWESRRSWHGAKQEAGHGRHNDARTPGGEPSCGADRFADETLHQARTERWMSLFGPQSSPQGGHRADAGGA